MSLNLNYLQEVLFSQSHIESSYGNLVPKLALTVRYDEYGPLFLDMGSASSRSLSSRYPSPFFLRIIYTSIQCKQTIVEKSNLKYLTKIIQFRSSLYTQRIYDSSKRNILKVF